LRDYLTWNQKVEEGLEFHVGFHLHLRGIQVLDRIFLCCFNQPFMRKSLYHKHCKGKLSIDNNLIQTPDSPINPTHNLVAPGSQLTSSDVLLAVAQLHYPQSQHVSQSALHFLQPVE
jgi:hypothetical protein